MVDWQMNKARWMQNVMSELSNNQIIKIRDWLTNIVNNHINYN